ncbi:MAG: AlpA family phage regulatory protein [Pseudomonadota bacterium]
MDKAVRPWEMVPPEGRLLRPAEVCERTGLSRSQIYSMIADGLFPPMLKLSSRASALPEAWLNAYVEALADKAVQKQLKRHA